MKALERTLAVVGLAAIVVAIYYSSIGWDHFSAWVALAGLALGALLMRVVKIAYWGGK